jgi:hypothetical protein
MKITYTLGALINLLTLAIGISIGFFVGTTRVKVVLAQVTTQQTEVPAAQPSEFEDITPAMTMPSAAIHTLLAHRIATDELMVNGYDILAFEENLINLLRVKGVARDTDLAALLERSRAPHPLRLKPVTPPPSKQPEQKP